MKNNLKAIFALGQMLQHISSSDTHRAVTENKPASHTFYPDGVPFMSELLPQKRKRKKKDKLSRSERKKKKTSGQLK